MSGYADEVAGAFDRSRACFEQIVAGLARTDADGQTHAQLEERLAGQGRELTRLLLQDHLDLRAVREQRQQRVVDAEQVAHTRIEGGHQRGLATVFGQVTVARMAYRAPGGRNLHPADAILNLPAGKHSHGLRRPAARESVRGSFEQASDAIWRTTGVRMGKRQIEQLAQATAVDIEAFYIARRPAPAGAKQLLVMQFDGKGIVMVPAALRAETAKAAARQRRKLSTRLSPGEKSGRARMAELAAVYDAEPVPRSPADVIARPAGGCRSVPPPRTPSGRQVADRLSDQRHR